MLGLERFVRVTKSYLVAIFESICGIRLQAIAPALDAILAEIVTEVRIA
jgi:hypothetical protein